MKKLHINLGPDSYDIHIEKGSFEQFAEHIRTIYKGRKVAMITDSNVDQLYGDQLLAQLKNVDFDTKKIVIPAGESSKHFNTLPTIFSALAAFEITRKDLIIAFGGGVIGDLAGFAAAIYLRGINFVQIPTTLLSQVDSSVGGKVGVDTDQGKNLVGNFKQPKLVLIDPNLLNTLTDHFFMDGMAEVIKYGCIFDDDFLELIQSLPDREALMTEIETLIYRSCDFKRQVVEEDEKDTGNRMLLNFGHTIGHALEAHTNYSHYSHGQAVAIGMVEIARLAEDAGLTQAGTSQRIQEICEQLGLPTSLEEYKMSDLIQYMKLDKKNLGDDLFIILLEKTGHSYIHPTTVNFFLAGEASK